MVTAGVNVCMQVLITLLLTEDQELHQDKGPLK